MVDYLVVGLGLAGISFCEQLDEHDKTYHVISDASQTSSSVAGGLYNPVILKRFTLAWMAKEQLEIATPFYRKLERKLNVKLDHRLSVLRRFASIEEQNLWFEAMDKPGLDTFLSQEIIPNENLNIDAPFGYGKVLRTGRIDTEKLLFEYARYLEQHEKLHRTHFDHSSIRVETAAISYQGIKARNIVFAEGFGLKNDPYFNYLPLNGTKGEYLIIEATDLKEIHGIKSSIFCIPLGKDRYKLGANYERDDKTNVPTEKAKEELLRKLETFINCDYTVVGQVAGVRPTVVDRRPLVGRHPEHERLFILNGMGSRGVLIAPYAARELFRSIEEQTSLNPEIDIARFAKKYFKTIAKS